MPRPALVLLAALALSGLPTASGRTAPIQPAARISVAGDPVAEAVAEASLRFGVPEAWIYAVIRAESAGDPKAVSPKGAMGLMQVMPQTFADLRAELGLGADPFAVHDNILAGAGYLRRLFDRYGSPGFLAAYNAGPARWEDHLAIARPLPSETLAYLAKLAPLVGLKSGDVPLAQPVSVQGSPLFAALDGVFTASRNGPGSSAIRSAKRLESITRSSAEPIGSTGRTGDFAAPRSALFAPPSPAERAP